MYVYYSHSLSGLTINLAATHKQYDLNIMGGGAEVGELGVASGVFNYKQQPFCAFIPVTLY